MSEWRHRSITWLNAKLNSLFQFLRMIINHLKYLFKTDHTASTRQSCIYTWNREPGFTTDEGPSSKRVSYKLRVLQFILNLKYLFLITLLPYASLILIFIHLHFIIIKFFKWKFLCWTTIYTNLFDFTVLSRLNNTYIQENEKLSIINEINENPTWISNQRHLTSCQE